MLLALINRIKYILLVVGILALTGCRSKQDMQVKISRLEQSLFSIPIDSVAAAVPRLRLQYGELFDLYSQRIIAIGTIDDPQYPDRLAEFLTDANMRAAYRSVMAYYPDVTGLEKGLSKAFSQYHRYFPQRAIPSVYTLISGFNQSMSVNDNLLAISLDKYLGANEEMYSHLGFAAYQKKLMDRQHIVPDCMKAWGYTEFPNADSMDNVLSNILYEGKIAYFVGRMLPEEPDSLLFGYTPDQMKWCHNNTLQMWTFLVEKKLLYTSDLLVITKLTGPAPFTALFTRESPGRAVVWLGYQIIRSYMKHHKVSLEELMSDNDYQRIFSEARFKP
jgi:hypothetical protein